MNHMQMNIAWGVYVESGGETRLPMSIGAEVLY